MNFNLYQKGKYKKKNEMGQWQFEFKLQEEALVKAKAKNIEYNKQYLE